MSRMRRSFDTEFKLQIVKMIKDQGLTSTHRSISNLPDRPSHNSPLHPMIKNTMGACRWLQIMRHSLRSVADGLGWSSG